MSATALTAPSRSRALQNLAGSFAALYNVQMAGALITALPTLAVFAFLGRYFVRGLMAGSLKG